MSPYNTILRIRFITPFTSYIKSIFVIKFLFSLRQRHCFVIYISWYRIQILSSDTFFYVFYVPCLFTVVFTALLINLSFPYNSSIQIHYRRYIKLPPLFSLFLLPKFPFHLRLLYSCFAPVYFILPFSLSVDLAFHNLYK